MLTLIQLLPQQEIILIYNIRKLPWYEDGYLIDPCNAKDMRNEQYVVLSHYLGNLIRYSRLKRIQGSINAVIGRLQEFKAACHAKISGESFSSWSPFRINLNLPAQPVYDKLAQIYVGAADQKCKI